MFPLKNLARKGLKQQETSYTALHNSIIPSLFVPRPKRLLIKAPERQDT